VESRHSPACTLQLPKDSGTNPHEPPLKPPVQVHVPLIQEPDSEQSSFADSRHGRAPLPGCTVPETHDEFFTSVAPTFSRVQPAGTYISGTLWVARA
jgi:hypothetical protein